jgi:leucyl-tRNA synthetase
MPLALPAEQFAIQNNRHPEEFTRANIAHFKNQIQSLGFSYDWSKELATIDPKLLQVDPMDLLKDV